MSRVSQVSLVDSQGSPITGAPPTILFYGTKAGVSLGAGPGYEENAPGVYVALCPDADVVQGLVVLADGGATAADRYWIDALFPAGGDFDALLFLNGTALWAGGLGSYASYRDRNNNPLSAPPLTAPVVAYPAIQLVEPSAEDLVVGVSFAVTAPVGATPIGYTGALGGGPFAEGLAAAITVDTGRLALAQARLAERSAELLRAAPVAAGSITVASVKHALSTCQSVLAVDIARIGTLTPSELATLLSNFTFTEQ